MPNKQTASICLILLNGAKYIFFTCTKRGQLPNKTGAALSSFYLLVPFNSADCSVRQSLSGRTLRFCIIRLGTKKNFLEQNRVLVVIDVLCVRTPFHPYAPLPRHPYNAPVHALFVLAHVFSLASVCILHSLINHI